MPKYDESNFDPPAPVALVTLVHPESGSRLSDVPMLIDSGADVTLVPQFALAHLKIETIPDKHYELMGFDGNIILAKTARLELVFHGRGFRGQFLLTEQDYGILGRNVLNTLYLAYNGPQLEWSEVTSNS